MQKHIETIGHITKEEALKILNFNIEPNTTVLETTKPFPGYHREIQEKGTPNTVFFVLKNPIYRESVSRLSKKLKNILEFDFDIVHSKIIINNQSFIAIRVFNISEYENVQKLQKAIINEGVVMYSGKIKENLALITTYTQFDFSESHEEIYQNNRNHDFFYFKISKELSWEAFKEITINIRNSWDLISFDAALGLVYMDNQVEDVVRIYAKNADLKDIASIKEKYLAKVK